MPCHNTEVTSLAEIGKYTDEILSYLKSCVSIDSSHTILSVEQTSVHNYIRLFEPLVIQALKQYTVTSSVILQQQVLHLLGQLVQLRVNYCLLDSDQIFLGFILKQFEHMEEGQIRDYQLLIPHIFHFLVMLSHERYHSKAVIALPQIIQLTGGIMASGQRASTHIIPAFRPLVQDLFVVKGQNKSESSKELDIMREVVVSNLLTLIKYHEVLELLVPVLYQAHRESEEKWKRLSRQVVDLLMPLLARQEVDIDTAEALSTLHHLLGTVSPIALRPVDILLKALFLVPCPLASRKSVQRWLALVLVLLCMLTTQSKEETVLSRLKELGLTVDLFVCPEDEEKDKDDDLVTRMPNKPEDIFARLGYILCISPNCRSTFSFFFSLYLFTFVIGPMVFAADHRFCCFQPHGTVHPTQDDGEDDHFLAQEAARLLLYLTHMFKSGAFRKVPLAMSAMLKAASHRCWFSLEQLNSCFVGLIATQPLIVIEWCQLLLIFGCSEKDQWMDFLRTPKRPPLSKSLSQGV
ncbi:putative huntingtin [Apostichopus japonicus]|uniref:Putative huntingtin n=1 Tax=Stichopus japonicus TaxID=307972 RepID=A0A2G8K7V1_STIJA|nr:putative huntingtin [Apostichopus japonicus]